MDSNLVFDFSVDKENKLVNVKREFSAPLQKVWKAWTDREQLDQWWAPEPWKTETKTMDFREGGRWLYSMVGPGGDRHYSLANYDRVDPEKSFSGLSGFSDEDGKINNDMPVSNWKVSFNSNDATTIVNIDIQYESAEDLDTEMGMGFKEGFTMGLANLDKLLAAQG
jgi:uncharacterized protein YndB with AHSA1/START domain